LLTKNGLLCGGRDSPEGRGLGVVRSSVTTSCDQGREAGCRPAAETRKRTGALAPIKSIPLLSRPQGACRGGRCVLAYDSSQRQNSPYTTPRACFGAVRIALWRWGCKIGNRMPHYHQLGLALSLVLKVAQCYLNFEHSQLMIMFVLFQRRPCTFTEALRFLGASILRPQKTEPVMFGLPPRRGGLFTSLWGVLPGLQGGIFPQLRGAK
jgi:hypothetical protein